MPIVSRNDIRPMKPSLVCFAVWMSFVSVFAAGQNSTDTPVLSLDSAVKIALANNRELRIAGLDVEKSKWQVAASKTKRLPSFNTYLLASGALTDSSFLFKKGSLGTFKGDPIPSQDAQIPLSSGLTGYALAQVAQPLTHFIRF